jgi:hypothetical protein
MFEVEIIVPSIGFKASLCRVHVAISVDCQRIRVHVNFIADGTDRVASNRPKPAGVVDFVFAKPVNGVIHLAKCT